MSIIGIDNELYRQIYKQLYRKKYIERRKILVKKLFYHKKSYCHCVN